MLKLLGIAMVAGISAALLYASTKPDTFRVERSISIKAPADKIFAQINDFRRFNAWSPYEKKDPNMQRTYSETTHGKGAVYAWHGNKEIGKGRMEILESSAPGKVMIQLDFEEPFEAHNLVEFTMTPKGDTTDVTWAMHGPNPFFGKVMHLFFDMDGMVGKDFEAGLATLKAIAET